MKRTKSAWPRTTFRSSLLCLTCSDRTIFWRNAITNEYRNAAKLSNKTPSQRLSPLPQPGASKLWQPTTISTRHCARHHLLCTWPLADSHAPQPYHDSQPPQPIHGQHYFRASMKHCGASCSVMWSRFRPNHLKHKSWSTYILCICLSSVHILSITVNTTKKCNNLQWHKLLKVVWYK